MMSESLPIPSPISLILHGKLKIQIEPVDPSDVTSDIIITRFENVGGVEWRPCGTYERYKRQYVEWLYNLDLSKFKE